MGARDISQPPHWARLACLGLFLAGVILPETIGWLRTDYSSVNQYISELGAIDAPYRDIINYGAFPLVGLFILLMLAYLWRQLRGASQTKAGLLCIAFGLPLAYVSAAAFPCDMGCPVEGSPRQMVHNITGLFQYIIGAAGFIILSGGLSGRVASPLRAGMFMIGVVMIGSFLIMLAPSQEAFRGLWQRLADYSAFGILSLLVFRLRPAHD